MIRRLISNPEIMRYLKNSAWMLAEYGLKVISAIFVTIYVARFLGPEKFGVLSYALAIVAIFMAISRLGMESILVRDLAKHPEERQAYMSTAFGLMLIAAILGVIALGGLVWFLEADPDTQLYIWVISSGIIFQAFLVIDYNFQSQVLAKYSSIAKSLALALSALSKLVLVWIGADLFYFALFYALDHLVIAGFLMILHLFGGQPLFFKAFQKRLIKPLLTSAWPMVSSAIAAILYMRIDQLMVKKMLGAEELGLYAAAVKIFEGWMVIPFVISISLLPLIVKMKTQSPARYEINMTILFSALVWSGIVVALIATLFGEQIVYYTFGSEFMKSIQVLVIVMWAAVFSALGSVAARYLTVERMEKKIAVRTFMGLVINVILNLFMIPAYGIMGAAVSTLITMFFANYMINLFDKDLRQLVRISHQAILLKWIWHEK